MPGKENYKRVITQALQDMELAQHGKKKQIRMNSSWTD